MIFYLIYIIISIIYYLVLDTGIKEVLKENPKYFNDKNIPIESAEIMIILLSILWPVSIVMLFFKDKINN